jgi:transcriptional regulator with XRE-family HTH domain
MDMNIDSSLIKSERQRRGWSQEHLAAATGLGVRTIQRIESSSVASIESAKSLAAVLEVPLERLMLSPRTTRRWGVVPRPLAYAGAAAVALLSAGLFMTRAHATEVAMNVVLGDSADAGTRVKVSAQDGKTAEIRLDNELRVVVTPRILKNDQILLMIELHRREGDGYKLIASPTLLVDDGKDAAVALNEQNGKSIHLSITPTQQK